ncbi:hypothetical protein CU097_009779 [Rhizopus azygosporus]|uniref:Dolichyl-diphosphooligosaccharide--protein glycosyltransferase subunit WBP1 n=2 Tax=Rhizopus TaxID=4842 RepID=A0A367K511_RHIAZ|nr:Dolichyl-diphosphooligosaccharide-protein glycosyltransferase 48kDa subunit [Rhizopus microsporus]RCH97268.1 hypothetical protein CU097_009779 [Rhizopus azygosporus]
MRSITSLIVLFVVSCLAFIADATSTTGHRVLVLLDSLSDKDNYTQFWQQLQGRGFDLVFKSADDPTTSLYYFGEQIFSHIIHFAPKSNLASHPQLNNVQLVNYVQKGGNMLIAVSSDVDDNVRALVSEFDIEVETEKVFDHTQFVEEHDLIATTNVIAPASVIEKKHMEAPILYSGVGLTVGNNPFSTAILNAERDAFVAESYQKGADTSHPVTLVGALQARNSARVTVVGSLDIFSDKLISSSVNIDSDHIFGKSGNEDFINHLSQWTFQEKGVLKIVGHYHHKENETEQRSWYRLKDDIVYTIDIAEYKDGQWVPFKANDIQLEVIMLDPYIRTTLKQVQNEDTVGRFEAHIKLPDVYGVFTFKVNYKRPGLTYLLAEDQVSIRPFRHNEYPRFLTAAYPYYTATGSMMIGFIVFSIVWLSTWGGSDLKKKNTKDS